MSAAGNERLVIRWTSGKSGPFAECLCAIYGDAEYAYAAAAPWQGCRNPCARTPASHPGVVIDMADTHGLLIRVRQIGAIGLLFLALAGCIKDQSASSDAGDLLLDVATLSRVQADEAARFQIDFKNNTSSAIYVGRGTLTGITSTCATNYFEVSGTSSLPAGARTGQLALIAGTYVVQWTTTSLTPSCGPSLSYRAGYEYHVTILSAGNPTVEESPCRECTSQTDTLLLLLAIRGKP